MDVEDIMQFTKIQKFTLIELLIVIAIIAVLLSILLPSLSKARYVSRVAVCASNQKQNIKALSLFFNDNNGKMPYRKADQPQYHRYSYSSGKWSNLGALYEKDYLGIGETLFCPQVNIDQAGKKESFSYYVNGGKFDPVSVLPTVSITASRTSYILYPYQNSVNDWKKITYSRMDPDSIIMGDVLWKKYHVYEGSQGWNISRVDSTVKFVKSRQASAYIDANKKAFFSSWGKTRVLRDMLNEAF